MVPGPGRVEAVGQQEKGGQTGQKDPKKTENSKGGGKEYYVSHENAVKGKALRGEGVKEAR